MKIEIQITPEYPVIFENWWLERLKESRIPNNLMKREIQNLRDTFTRRRERGFLDYSMNESSIIAYGLYIFPQTYLKLSYALIEILNKGIINSDKKILNIIDLGAGTGAGLFSAVNVLSNKGISIRAVAIEKSETSVKYLKNLYLNLKENLPAFQLVIEQNDFIKGLQKFKNEEWDIIIMNYSLGEAFYGFERSKVIRFITKLMSRLSEDGVLVILEPALRETAELLEELRDYLVQENYNIYAPCPHNKPCPLLKERKFWCHEVRRWSPPSYLFKIDRRFYYTLSVLRFSFISAGKKFVGRKPLSRLISPFSKMKGKYIFTLCGYDGVKHRVEILKKKCSPELKKVITTLQRGDEVESDFTRIYRFGIDVTSQLFFDVTA